MACHAGIPRIQSVTPNECSRSVPVLKKNSLLHQLQPQFHVLAQLPMGDISKNNVDLTINLLGRMENRKVIQKIIRR